MTDDPKVTGGQARRMINMNLQDDVAYWTRMWNISREQLQGAVDVVGGKEARIADYLRAKGIIRF